MSKINFSIFSYLVLFFFSPSIHAQNLIPYLAKNGLYGYADEATGKVLIAPKYKGASCFDEKGIAFPTTIDDKYVVLLNDGTETAFKGGYVSSQQCSYAVRTQALDDKVGDTLENLLIVKMNNQIVFLKKDKEGTKKYIAKNLKPYIDVPRFLNGYCPILKPNDKQNVLDENLNELLKNDVLELNALGNDKFLIQNEAKQYAIINKKEQFVVPFHYKMMNVLLKSNRFAVSQGGFNQKVGMMDDNGKLVMDTIYTGIYSINDRFLLATNAERKQGIFDYEGKMIIPMQYTFLVWIFGDYFSCQENYTNYNVINTKNEKQFKEDNLSCTFQRFSFPLKSNPKISRMGGYYVVYPQHHKDSCYIADSTFRTLATFNQCKGMEATLRVDDVYFIQTKTDKKKGIVSPYGKVIVPTEYDDVRLEYTGCYKVRKDKQWGVYSPLGEVIIPCEKAAIEMTHRNKETFYWVQERDDTRYICYDGKGKKVTQVFNRKDNYYVPPFFHTNEYRDGKYYKTLLSGKKVLHDQVRDYESGYISNTSNLVFYKRNGDFQDYRNDQFEPIAPKGYATLSKHQSYHINSGLFTVVKVNEDPNRRIEVPATNVQEISDEAPAPVQLRPKVKPAPPQNNNNVKADNQVTEKESIKEEVVKADYGIEEAYQVESLPEYDENTTGVVNYKGEWVIELKKNAVFQSISAALVLEKTPNPRYNNSYNGEHLLHRLALSKSEPLAITDIQKHRAGKGYIVTKWITAGSNGRKEQRQALLDSIGNLINDFTYTRIFSDRFVDTTFVHIRAKNDEMYAALVNDKGKELVNYGAIEFSNLLEESRLIIARKGDKYGLIDFGGTEILPFEYHNLQYISNREPIFMATDKDNTPSYFTLSQKIFQIPTTPYQPYSYYSFYRLDNGTYIASRYESSENIMKNHLLAASGAYLRALPNGVIETHWQTGQGKNILKIADRARNQYFYINLETAQEYLEK